MAAGLHGRNRWRLPVLLMGMLFAGGRRTVTTWLRAAGVSDDYQDYYYFLASVGRKSEAIATQLVGLVLCVLPLPEQVLLVLDDSPTKRYGPRVEGADVHHNPTPGPADQPFLYGHVWVTISLALRHPRWGSLALPLRALLYVRQRTMATIPKRRRRQCPVPFNCPRLHSPGHRSPNPGVHGCATRILLSSIQFAPHYRARVSQMERQ